MTAMTPPADRNYDPIPVRVLSFPDPKPDPLRPASVRVVTIDNTAGANPVAHEILGNIPNRERALIRVTAAVATVCVLAKDRGTAQGLQGFPVASTDGQPTELSDTEEWHIGVPAGASVTVGVYAQMCGTR